MTETGIALHGEARSQYAAYKLQPSSKYSSFSVTRMAPNTACTRLVGVCAFSGSLRGLKFGSVKMALSRPAHQRVTHTVGRLQVTKEKLNMAEFIVREETPTKLILETDPSYAKQPIGCFTFLVLILLIISTLIYVFLDQTFGRVAFFLTGCLAVFLVYK